MACKSPAKNILLLLVCLATFAGCSMSLSVFDVKRDNFSGCISNHSELRLSAKTFESPGDSRTIMPPSVSDYGDYDYYLRGTEMGGAVFPNTKITVNGDGYFSAPVGNGFWNLLLFAVPHGTPETDALGYTESDIIEKASLIARTSIEVTGPEKRVPFTLSPDTLKTGGFVCFKIKLSDGNGSSAWTLDGSQYECHAEIVNLTNGETVKYEDEDGNPTSQMISFDASGIGTFGRDPDTPTVYDPTFISADCAIAPGTYSFRVTFTREETVSGITTKETVATWSDIILVIPNRTTTGNGGFVYIPNIIGQPPATPTSFTATYVKGSEDLVRYVDGNEENHEGFYQVHFQWECEANNETGFEIQVADVSGQSIRIVEVEGKNVVDWTSVSDESISTYTNSLYAYRPDHEQGIYLGEGNPDYVDGSLESNSTSVTMYLELGRQYAARIRAYNYAGASKWVDVDLTLPTISSTSYEKYNDGTNEVDILPFVTGGSSVSPLFINRFRITYCLNGGVYEIEKYATVNKDKVVYASQCNPAVPKEFAYWDGSGRVADTQTDDLRLSTVEYNESLKKDEWVDKAFKYWCKNYDLSVVSRVYEKDSPLNRNYTGYGNLTLYADYGNAGSVTVNRTLSDYRADYDLQGKWFSVYANSEQLTSSYGTYYRYTKPSPSDPHTSLPLTIELKIPKDVDSVTDGEQRFYQNYNKIDCVVTDLAGNKKYSLPSSSPPTTPPEKEGYDIEFPVAECDVSDWSAGLYLFKFTATATVPPSGTEITREMTLILDLTN